MEKKYHYVYVIINKINGKFYIGIHSTNDLNDGYMGSGYSLRKAFAKYNKKMFEKQIIIFLPSREHILDYERILVNENMIANVNCYNTVVGGGAPKSNFRHADEFKKIISDKLKGRKFSDSHRLNLSKSARRYRTEEEKEHLRQVNLGKKHSQETINKMIASRIGRPCKEETKKKIGDAQRGELNHRFGKCMTSDEKEFRRKRCKTRIRCCIDGIEYDSIKYAAKCLGVHANTVRKRIDSDLDIWKTWVYL